MRRSLRALCFVVAAFASVGCTFDLAPLVTDVADAATDASTDGTFETSIDAATDVVDASDASDATSDGTLDAPADADATPDTPDAPRCPSDMVEVPGPAGKPSFCIDAKEVSAGDYQKWLAGSPSTAGQPSYCSWNTSFAPNPDSTYPKGWWPPDATHMNHPIRWVDWCDAYAYCKAVGKHMCGAFGGGPISFSSVGDATKSEWMQACSAGGTRAYPYGATYVTTSCNGKDAGIMYPAVSGSLLDCVGGYPGLYDMSGNVTEWEDNCQGTTGASDTCETRGGDYGSYGTTKLTCAGPGETFTRNTTTMYAGIRCCKD